MLGRNVLLCREPSKHVYTTVANFMYLTGTSILFINRMWKRTQFTSVLLLLQVYYQMIAQALLDHKRDHLKGTSKTLNVIFDDTKVATIAIHEMIIL